MTSHAQLLANQANSQKSTGPRSPAGKQRSRLNAYRHGLTGQVCIFTPEDQDAFEKHCAGIREALQPVGALELDLSQAIAEDRWRLKRARAVESGIFALGQSGVPETSDPGQAQIDEALAQARTWLAEGKNLQLLALYEQRIHRATEKNMAELRALQEVRKAAHQEALKDAQLLAQLAYMKNEEYDPADYFPPEMLQNGSDFSPASINRLILRKRRLKEARHCAATGWDPEFPYDHPLIEIPTAA
jgi:hypothetical protein